METNPSTTEPDFTSPSYIGAITHFYRGELGRIMVWRERFDATTNWAIVASGSLAAFAVQTPALLNEAMLITLCVLGFFALIEARRFRFYDAFRARVRMLEVHFIAPTLLGHDRRLLQGPWREQLAEDLITPTFKCTFLFALGRRFKRVYFALHLFVIGGWFALRLLNMQAPTFERWVASFEVGWLPGAYVLLLLLGYYTVLGVLILRSGALRATSGEVGRRIADVEWVYQADD